MIWMLMGICSSCASIGNPSGGGMDKTPPKLDSLRSAVNYKVNFKPRELVFYFDEFVEVKDAIKQVLVSPPLTYIPKVKGKGKRVTFAFDEKEVLRENATYTINFGEAIVDFHEGNKLQNFTYVFATGSFLDSLNISGQVIDALTHEGEAEMAIYLYDNLQDSTVRKEKPFYFAKPNKEGKFEFRNIKSDTFRIFALKDENLNYKYDLENEKIAFVNELIVLRDTSVAGIELHASLPKPIFKVKSIDSKSYGKVKFNGNSTAPKDYKITLSEPNIKQYTEIVNDSILLWYETDLDSFNIFHANDTTKVKVKRPGDFLKKAKFRLNTNQLKKLMLPSDSLELRFNYPMSDFDPKNIVLYDTIGFLEDVKTSLSPDHKSLIIKYPWEAGATYVLELDSAALHSMYGIPLDSIGHIFTIITKDKSANLAIQLSQLDSNYQYLVRILKDNIPITSLSIKELSAYDIILKGLLPEKYNIEIIEDTNRNGQWDAGNFETKTQPERYLLHKGEKLRENKDTEWPIAFKDGQKPVTEKNQGLENNPLNSKQKK